MKRLSSRPIETSKRGLRDATNRESLRQQKRKRKARVDVVDERNEVDLNLYPRIRPSALERNPHVGVRKDDVVWRASPPKTKDVRGGTVETKQIALESEFEVISKILAKVRRKHGKMSSPNELISSKRPKVSRDGGPSGVIRETKPPTPRERRCNELLKLWLARTPSVKSRKKKRKSRKKKTVAKSRLDDVDRSTHGKRPFKLSHDNGLGVVEGGGLLATLDKVEKRLQLLKTERDIIIADKDRIAVERNDHRSGEDGDDSEFEEEFSGELETNTLVESLKVLEAWESQSHQQPINAQKNDSDGISSETLPSQALFECRMNEAEKQDPRIVASKMEDEDDSMVFTDDEGDSPTHGKGSTFELTGEMLRWIETVETKQRVATGECKANSCAFIGDEDDSFSDSEHSLDMSACVEMLDGFEKRAASQRHSDETRTNVTEQLSCGYAVRNVTRGTDDSGPFVRLELERCGWGEDASDEVDGQKEWSRKVKLRNEWADLEICKDDRINIFGTSASAASIETLPSADTLDVADEHLVVLHPDLLLSPSRISQSFPCLRRGLFSEWLRSSQRSRATVLGQMKHELFERCLRNRNFDARSVQNVARELLADFKFMKDLVAVDEISNKTVMSELLTAGERMQWWAVRHIQESSVATPILSQPLELSGCGEHGELMLSDVVAVEENVWSPKWGIKGMIDATVVAEFSSSTSTQNNSSVRSWLLPLELKTGAHTDLPAISHRAQVLLYSLLLCDRYGSGPTPRQSVVPDFSAGATEAGLLLYSGRNKRRRGKTNKANRGSDVDVLFTSVPLNAYEIRSLLNQRNMLAIHLHRLLSAHDDVNVDNLTRDHSNEKTHVPASSEFPPMMRDKFMCKGCYQLDACAVYHSAVEGGGCESSGFDPDLWNATVGHMTKVDKDYFRRWDRLLNVEAGDISAVRSALWRLPARRRVQDGTCLRLLTLDSVATMTSCEYQFRAQSSKMPTTEITSRSHRSTASTLSLSKGDLIVVSFESINRSVRRSQYAVGAGTILDIDVSQNPTRVNVRLWHPLPSRLLNKEIDGTWRIDRDEIRGGMSTAKENLIRLFVGNDEKSETGRGDVGDAKRRRLVVRLESPRFSYIDSSTLPWYNSNAHRDVVLDAEYEKLNEDQRVAVVRAFAAEDYALIRGMPGTGKTCTVAFFIRALLHSGRSVLVTSYTHSAVDNLLMKVMDRENRIVRIGAPRSVHPDVRHRCPESLLSKSPRQLGTLASIVSRAGVVGATCLSAANSPLLQRRTFDVCIVDEAGQITQPVCIGPLRKARSFVLVGDENQLAPLVRNSLARKGGLNVSLFERLASRHPDAISQLRFQYRMNADIMCLSNEIVYNGQLRCGNRDVEEKRLVLNKCRFRKLLDILGASTPSKESTSWIERALRPSASVLFLNTDELVVASRTNCVDTSVQGQTRNAVEASLVTQIVRSALYCGVDPKDIGVISPYRAQLRFVRQHLGSGTEGVEVSTVDKYQGRDKECVIFSLVRRSKETGGSVGRLLSDWRRLNVAFTRAKSKLIVVGSSSTLQCDPHLKKFLHVLTTRSWTHTLRPDAQSRYEKVIAGLDSPSPSTPSSSHSPSGRVRINPKLLCKKSPILKNVLDGSL